MRRCLILPVLVITLLASPRAVPQSSHGVLDTKKIFITSFFDCPVYSGRRQIGVLRNGTRARLLRSTKGWILVRFFSKGKYVVGWIRR